MNLALSIRHKRVDGIRRIELYLVVCYGFVVAKQSDGHFLHGVSLALLDNDRMLSTAIVHESPSCHKQAEVSISLRSIK